MMYQEVSSTRTQDARTFQPVFGILPETAQLGQDEVRRPDGTPATEFLMLHC